MRKSFASIAFSLSLLASASAFGAEGLFSDVSLNSTLVAPSTNQTARPPVEYEEPQQLPPSGPADQLSLALLVAGYQPKDVSESVVSITLRVDELSIPVLISTGGNNQLRLTLLLTSLADVQQLPTANLLKLLSTNRSLQPAFFAYNEQLQQIELQKLVPASSTGGSQLRDELDGLAEIAKKSEKLWNIGQMVTSPTPLPGSPAVAEQPKPTTTGTPEANPKVTIAPAAPPTPSQPQAAAPAPKQATAPATKSPLVGTWSAEISKQDAFGLLIKSDGSFVLVHVKSGKKTQTSGKSSVAGNVLTLTSSDGTKLAGTVTLKSAQEFEFRPQSATASTKSLIFKKAS